MIRRIYSSDLATFKNIEFRSGLNVILAEKSEGATDKQTRNRAGKSSMIELVHFLLGGNTKRDSLFRHEELQDYTFGMEFDLAQIPTRVERTGTPRTLLEVEGDFSGWPVQPDERDDARFISNVDWKRVLGDRMFDLGEYEGTWNPSFRSLISYFARREGSGGIKNPMEHFQRQSKADQQISISYLLGLDWTIAKDWQQVRDNEKTIKTLKKALNDGAFGKVIQKASSLRSQLIVAEARVKDLREQVSSFEVVDEYQELEKEASALTRRLGTLADENTLDHRYVSEIEQTSVDELAPPPADLDRLYRQAGIVLPALVQKRFEDVQVFHDSVIRNRKSYLRNELSDAKRRVTVRNEEMKQLDRRRAELMNILQSAGALEHFTALQGEVARAEAEIETLRHRYEDAELIESNTLKLHQQRNQLQERLRQDYSEQESEVVEAVLTFERISAALYEKSKAGSFTVTPTDNGPEFGIEIHGSKSKGVKNMQIFCFDMMLTLLSLKKGRSPGFLIHDSHLFDGVDERQVGMALALGAELADEHGFQYIVTLNTDEIPDDIPGGFELNDYVLDTRLNDSTETGGLFGFRFD